MYSLKPHLGLFLFFIWLRLQHRRKHRWNRNVLVPPQLGLILDTGTSNFKTCANDSHVNKSVTVLFTRLHIVVIAFCQGWNKGTYYYNYNKNLPHSKHLSPTRLLTGDKADFAVLLRPISRWLRNLAIAKRTTGILEMDRIVKTRTTLTLAKYLPGCVHTTHAGRPYELTLLVSTVLVVIAFCQGWNKGAYYYYYNKNLPHS